MVVNVEEAKITLIVFAGIEPENHLDLSEHVLDQ